MDAIKLLKGLMGNQSLASGLGGKLLGGLLGGGGGQAAPQQQQQSSGGGLGGMLGGMLGGGGSQGAGGLMGLLGGGGQESGGGIGSMIGGLLGGGGQPEAAAAAQAAPAPQSDGNDQAVLFIRAMVNAAKSDGRVDETEQQNIISKLGDVSQDEINFLKGEFAAPLDVASFARSIPKGLEQQIYAVSLTSIELDSQNEAQYLGQLAQGLNIDPQVCNQIHDQLGAPKIFQ